MEYRICPFCKEKIYSNALVCRFCKRDLSSYEHVKRSNSLAWVPAVAATAFIVAGAAFLTHEFLKERRSWTDRQ